LSEFGRIGVQWKWQKQNSQKEDLTRRFKTSALLYYEGLLIGKPFLFQKKEVNPCLTSLIGFKKNRLKSLRVDFLKVLINKPSNRILFEGFNFCLIGIT